MTALLRPRISRPANKFSVVSCTPKVLVPIGNLPGSFQVVHYLRVPVLAPYYLV